MLKAGAARSVITPPTGLTMAGYAARQGVAIEKDGELYATALVIDDEHTRVAMFSFDLLSIQEPFVTRLRHVIGNQLGTPASHVLLNFSHTHSGPTTATFQYDDDPTQSNLRATYADWLEASLPALAALAARRQKPARMGTGTGEARIGIHRREKQPDGTALLGENPLGPVDHEVRVIRVDDTSGRPIAVVFSHGCHTVTMGPKSQRWSADYIGPAREIVERAADAPSIFLQANAGDINPITGIGDAEDDSDEKKRLGAILGSETVKVLAGIYTESVRGPKTMVGSLSKLPYFPRLPLTREPDSVVAAIEEQLKLPLLPFPSLQDAERAVGHWEHEVNTLEKSEPDGPALHAGRLFRRWAHNLRRAVAEHAEPAVQIGVQGIRIGGIAIAAVPGETFSTLGLEVKKHSPVEHTLFLGYSNGCIAYIPTSDVYPADGWDPFARYYVPDLLFQGYGLPMAFTPDCGDRVVRKALDVLGRLTS